MGRVDLNVQYATCHKGINQQAELASLEECADARNVWAPNGRVVRRPGYVGVTALNSAVVTTNTLAAWYSVVETPIGTFTSGSGVPDYVLNNLAIGSRWYLIIDDTPLANGLGITLPVLNPNGNTTWAAIEYWNGTGWAPLHADETNEAFVIKKHLFTSVPNEYLWFPFPNDWVRTTTNGIAGYPLRFLIEGTALDGATSISPNGVGAPSWLTDGSEIAGSGVITITTPPVLVKLQFPFTTRYLSANQVSSLAGSTGFAYYLNCGAVSRAHKAADIQTSTTIAYKVDEPPTVAVVPQFEEAYLAYNRIVTRHSAYPAAADDVTALVESDPLIVGPGAPYDADQIIQLSAWPKCKYITFFRDRLWAVNLDDSGDYSIRWSAPVPYHHVWPVINIETLMEDDNSPTTGACGFQQNLTVFKEDSIWMMEDVGTTDLGLESFNPRRVVAGVGCVSNSSVAEVQGRLVFLAEDGIYAYNGTPQIEKLSYRIQDTINSINPARRPFAKAVNLSQKNLYLLAVAVNGSNTNNLVIVWDYKNDVWWLWDSLEVQQWLLDEGASDDQRLYFQDSHMRVFEFFVGNQDNGSAISSYVLTQRFDYSTASRDAGDAKQRVRMVQLISTNDSRDATIELRSNDEPAGTIGAIDYTDDAEADWSALVWAVDTYTVQRRRKRRLMFYRDIDWCQVKVSHSTKNAPFEMASVGVGFLPLGRR